VNNGTEIEKTVIGDKRGQTDDKEERKYIERVQWLAVIQRKRIELRRR
jgi:hypothetical protein